jgi:hypothetical protein
MKALNSPTIVIWNKSETFTWAEHVARMEAIKNAYNILVGILEVKTLGIQAYIGGYY